MKLVQDFQPLLMEVEERGRVAQFASDLRVLQIEVQGVALRSDLLCERGFANLAGSEPGNRGSSRQCLQDGTRHFSLKHSCIFTIGW